MYADACIHRDVREKCIQLGHWDQDVVTSRVTYTQRSMDTQRHENDMERDIDPATTNTW